MHMLTNLMISVGVDAADVWSYTNAPALLDLVERREEGERYYLKYTRPSIYNIIMYGKGQKG